MFFRIERRELAAKLRVLSIIRQLILFIPHWNAAKIPVGPPPTIVRSRISSPPSK